MPQPASNLLQVAYLRAECVRTGVQEVTVTKSSGAVRGRAGWRRLSPVVLAQSKQMRLARLYKGALYKEDQHQLQLPMRSGPTIGSDLVEALRQLVPATDPQVPAVPGAPASGGTGTPQ